jgi:hypothetical protein
MADRMDDRMADRLDGWMADRLDDRMGGQMVHSMVDRGRADHLGGHLRRNWVGHAEGRQRPRLVDLLSERVDPFLEGLLEGDSRGYRNRI